VLARSALVIMLALAAGVPVGAPAATPLGGTLLVGYAGVGGADVISPDGSNHRAFLPPGDFGPSYSLDGTHILYNKSGFPVIADSHLRDPKYVQTAPLVTVANEPSLSPDGAHVVFAGTGQQLYVASVEGTDVHQITGSSQDDRRPVWSPRGDLIAFTRASATTSEVFTVSPTGGDRQITFGGNRAYSLFPAWSPDGRRLAFLEETASGNHVTIMNADGSDPEQVTKDFPQWGTSAPAWSPDGTRLAFAEADGKVDLIGVDKQNWSTVFQQAGTDVMSISWRPEGAGISAALDVLDPLVARRTLRVSGDVRSIGSGPSTSVVVSISLTNAGRVRATLAGGTCTSSARTATCTAASVPGDTDLPLAITIAGARPGRMAIDVDATASNDTTHWDDVAQRETSVSSCTVLGTDRADHLKAYGGDIVCGLGGDDVINARNGERDTIDGGADTDTAIVDRVDVVRHVEHIRRPKH
jgi:WD40 repeat protein